MATLVNRAKVSTGTTGTGTVTLGSAVSGFQTFADAGVSNGDTVRYVIEDGTSWELGTGTYSSTGPTLTRTVAESSAGGSALNLSGNAEVFISATSADTDNWNTAYGWGDHSTEGYLTGNQTITLSGDVSGSGTTAISVTVADDSHNHVIANVDGLQAALDAKLDDSQKGAANGLAELDGSGKVPSAQLPSYVDDVLEYANSGSFPGTGETGKIYIALDTNDVYRWTGSAYVKVSDAVSTADEANTLATARTISLAGDVTGSTSFDGSANVSITATVADDSHNHVISNVDGLQTALDGKVDDSQVQTDVPAGAVFTDTTYSVGDGGLTEKNFTTALKNKLDGVESGATADQSASEILTAIKTVDGSGSGLDADLLDGSDATAFATSDQGSNADTAFGWGDHSTEGYLTGNQTITLTGDVSGSGTTSISVTVADDSHNHVIANVDGLQTALDGKLSGNQTITLSGDVSGSGTTSIAVTVADDSHNHVIANVDGLQAALDGKLTGNQTITLSGDVSGSGTTSIAVTVADDSHNHVISNVDGLQTALDSKQAAATALTTSTTFGGDVSGTYNSIVVADDSHTHDTRYVLKTGDTMTGKLVLSDAGYSLGNYKHEWQTSYTLNITTPKELLYSDGNSLPAGGVYRFSAHIDGTGTDNWATAVYWNQNGTWKLNVTQQSGVNSNNPEFIISNGVPTLAIDHSSNYTVRVFSERLELNEGIGTDNNAGFGADSFLGSVGGVLRYNPDGSATSYAYGYPVFHDNYHPNADKWTTSRTLSLTGDVTGSVSWDGSGNASLTATVADDSHNHVISNVDGLQTALDGKLSTSGKAADSNLLDGLNSTQFLRSDQTGSITGGLTVGGALVATASTGNHFNGHHYFTPYDANGNHYPHYEHGGNSNGAQVHMRVQNAADGWDVLYIAGDDDDITWRGSRLWSEANDGAGSGLDADLLDGQHGSYYYSPANAPDPTLTLSGDATGSATFTNLGNATLSVTVADDSHNHVIANVDGLQTALDGKQAAGTYNTIIGTDSDINTSGSTIIDNIFVTDGVITSMGTRALTLGDLGYTGETNATADQTASEILTAIKTVDGSGSGLDADLLDGQQGSVYMRKSADSQLDMNNNDIVGVDQIIHEGDSNTYIQFHAADQWRVVTGGTERLEVNNSAVTVPGTLNVRGAVDLADNDILRLGSSDDWEFFHNGSHNYMDCNVGDLYIRQGTTSRYLFDVSSGNFHADGNIIAYSTSVSDERLKDDINTLEDPLSLIDELRGVTFTRKDQQEKSSGVIAQELEKVMPWAVKENQARILKGDETVYKTVEYDALSALFIESIKALKDEIADLKQQLENK